MKLPKTFEDFMSTGGIPDKFSKTSYGGKFLVHMEYVYGEPFVVFISDSNNLKTHHTWILMVHSSLVPSFFPRYNSGLNEHYIHKFYSKPLVP